MRSQNTTIVAPVSLGRPYHVQFGHALVYATVVIISIMAWQLASFFTLPIFLPGPAQVARTGWSLVWSGEIFTHISMSYFRILTGWAIGSLVAIPVGLVAGRIGIIRIGVTPHINFFRFIPPIAFIGLSIIWLGLGEESKISLIVYTALFTVFLNVLTGAQSVEKERIWAAQCLGASAARILWTVVIPSTIPYVVTGLRVAMGASFMTVIAAEIVAADSGVGYLIWNSRLFAQTDLAFVGILALGLMGLCADLVFRLAMSRLAHRYDLKF